MKKFRLFTLVTAGLLLSTGAFAQLPMTRTTFTGSYAPIAMPGATLSTATGDDVAQSAIPLGFTFNYLGTNYTTIGVNTNGVASFDPTMSMSGTNTNLYSNTAPQNCLAPWWDNLWSDTILYQLQGTSPNQTFTIQWTNSFSYANTATQRLNFQVILYETTNIIEFSYGPMISGVAANNESASIGLEGGTGGPGNYLDAVTGSCFTSNGMLASADEWPSHNFRFTPGAPTALGGGTYTVGASGNYFSLSEAIADINHRGISGAVSLSLIDPTYDVTPAGGDNFFPMLLGPVTGSSSTNTIMIMPATGTASLVSDGANSGNAGNQGATNIFTNANEPVFALVGASYVTLSDLNISCSPTTGVVERGISVINSSGTIGSQHNTIQNITVALNRTNNATVGIDQRALTTVTNATGANSYNSYLNLDISNTYIGIYLTANATFPDLNCEIGNTSPTQFNHIGAATPGDIGDGTVNSYGIRVNNESGVSIYNNEVRNMAQTGNSNAEGIVVDAGQGNISVYRNKVHDIYYTGATNTGNLTGIRANLVNAGTNTVRVYNNFVYNIGSSYAGAATATRAVRGIYAQSIGGGTTTDTINIDFNNVRLDNSSSPNLSGTCFESGATNGPVINVRNNVFTNFTGVQTGNARHFVMASPTATAIGNTGSVSDYNDLYVNDTTNGNGRIGVGGAAFYTTLAGWQTAMTQDANSLSSDPGFSTATDLHVSTVGLNNTGSMTGIGWVVDDIDNQTRLVTPDIGADEFVPLLLDAAVTTLVAPVNSGCHTATEQVTVTLKNFASVPLDFTIDPVTVTVNITGAVTQTLTFTINNNSLNGGNPLASAATMNVPVGTFNMTTIGTYMFDASAALTGDGNPLNDAMSTVNVDYMPGTATSTPVSVCDGSSITLTLTGSSAGGTIQWMSSADGGSSWSAESGTGSNTASYTVTPTDTMLYQVQFCNLMTNIDTVLWYPLSAPVVADDTVCGPGQVTLNASGTGTINWYAAATGGNPLSSGASFTTSVSADTTFYVSNISGNLTQGIGLFDNSAGGAMSGSTNNLIFDVLQACTLNGVYVYPAAAGTVTVLLEDNAFNVINTATVNISAADVNQRTYIPLNFALSPGTNMQLLRDASSVNLWRNNVGVNYPYTLPGVVSITGSTAGAGFYYFFYDWQINYGCESGRTPVNVVVTAPPTIAITAGSTMLCLGDSTSISVNSVNTNYAYTWTPGGTLSSTTGSTVTATPSASTTYTVNALDSGTGCRAIDSVMVTVNSVPNAVINAMDTLVCPGQNDTLVAMHPAWSVGLSDNSAGGNQSASANNLIFDVYQNCTLGGVYIYPGAAGNVTIDLEDNTNAVINTASYTVTAAQVNQRVYVPLNFPLTPGTGMQLVRNATSVNLWRNNVGVTYPYDLPGYLSITTSTAGGNFYYFFYDWQIYTSSYSYAWTSVPSGFTATGDSAFIAPTVSTQYIVTITDSVTGCVAQFNRTINIATPVTVSMSGPSSICAGDSATFIAMPSGGDGNLTYTWINATSSNDTAVVTPSATQTYSVIVADGCGNVDTASSTLVVTSGPPTGTFSAAATATNTFTFTDNTTGAVTYAWDFGDSNTDNTANPVHGYAAQGTYTVTLIVTNGCGSDTITQTVLVDGIDAHGFAVNVQAYPNPAHDQVQLSFGNLNPSYATIELFDLQGHLLLRKQANNLKSGTTTIDVSTLAKGMYMLQVKTDTGSGVLKVTVE